MAFVETFQLIVPDAAGHRRHVVHIWRIDHCRHATNPPAPDPVLIEKFAKQAHDLDALRNAVEDAASVSAGFWLSYLFVLFYIGIAAGGVTHKDLLLENPVKLPFLNVELPLVAFFFLAPILYIVSHAYTLVHFVMLAAKVGAYNTELKNQLGNAPETRDGRYSRPRGFAQG
jgi:hypothetical protein